MLALDGRVRNLERVEHAHRDLVGQLRQRAGDSEEPDLPRIAEVDQLGDRVVLRERLGRGADVELDEVEVVGTHAAQTLLDARPYVLAREDVLASRRALRADRFTDRAAALAGQEVLVATV